TISLARDGSWPVVHSRPSMAPETRDPARGTRDAFPPTRVSVVRGIASADPAVRREAYNALVRQYWRPVYAYIRLRWHRDPADAQDLTQEFFTRALEKEYLE